jgi:hypothetical protein
MIKLILKDISKCSALPLVLSVFLISWHVTVQPAVYDIIRPIPGVLGDILISIFSLVSHISIGHVTGNATVLFASLTAIRYVYSKRVFRIFLAIMIPVHIALLYPINATGSSSFVFTAYSVALFTMLYVVGTDNNISSISAQEYVTIIILGILPLSIVYGNVIFDLFVVSGQVSVESPNKMNLLLIDDLPGGYTEVTSLMHIIGFALGGVYFCVLLIIEELTRIELLSDRIKMRFL